MSKLAKYSTICLLVMLASTMLIASAVAQDEDVVPPQYPPNPNRAPTPPPSPVEQAIVLVTAAVGGTTDPAPGTYTYDAYETISFEATPNSGYKFLYWIISGVYTPGHNLPPINYPQDIDVSDPEYTPDFPSPSEEAEDSLVTSTNPLAVICGYGYTYTYQPVFAPTTAAPSTNDAIVVVLDSMGGTTSPGAGTYYYADGSTISLTATPNAGYDFVQWVAVGEEGHPTVFKDNPAGITCGYGYMYSYQAMFAPTGTSTTTEEGIPLYIYAVIIVLVIIAIIGLGAALMYRGKGK